MTSQTNESPAEAPEQEKRYAAYDNTLLKFIGGVLDTAAKVRAQEQYKAAKKAEHDVEVREV